MTKFADLLGTVSDDVRQAVADAGFTTLDEIVTSLLTPSLRSEFATRYNLNQAQIYELAIKSDLLRIVGVNVQLVNRLVAAGVGSASELVNYNVDTLQQTLSAAFPGDADLFTAAEISKWQNAAKRLETSIEPDVEARAMRALSSNKPEKVDVFFSDMPELIADLGRGIAEAQRAMDENTIHTQELINQDEELRAYGINATWYVIPEADVSLKMHYTITKESSGSGVARRKILISPINGRYQSFFKSAQTAESTLNLKIRPLPAESRVADLLIAPNVVGMSKANAITELRDSNLIADVDDAIAADAIVTSQSPAAGEEVRFRDRVALLF